MDHPQVNGRYNPTSKATSGLWHHGDQSKRHSFGDQRMDRDASHDRNACGPGIYWTRDEDQAKGYAWPSGWVYAMTLREGARVLSETKRVSRSEITRFIRLAPVDSRETGATNWDEDRWIGEAKAVAAYARNGTLFEALVSVYNDFYGQDAEAYAVSMVELGYDALLHKLPAVDHLVVWNPGVIHVEREEKYEPA